MVLRICGEIFESGDAGFVAEEVFAVLHGANADGGALVGDLRAEDKLSGRIVDDLVLRRDDLDVGIALFERGQLVLFASPGRDQHAAATLYGADHAMDVVVAHAADGEFDGVLRLGVGLLSGLGDLMDDMASAKGRFGQSSQHSCGTHCLEKRTPVETIHLHVLPLLSMPIADICVVPSGTTVNLWTIEVCGKFPWKRLFIVVPKFMA